MAGVTMRRARRAERGSVLMIVTVMGLLAMALWGLAWRGTHDDIRLERVETLRDVRTKSLYPALADMLDLLRSGRPPSDPYACLVTESDGAGGVWQVAATFTSDGDQDHWSVDCRAATETQVADLPAAPATFGS
jgi:hypothetical protein